jgi:hypothetical protein
MPVASGSIERGAKVDEIDGGKELGKEGLVCSLTEFRFLFEFPPDFASSFDLGAVPARGVMGPGSPGVTHRTARSERLTWCRTKGGPSVNFFLPTWKGRNWHWRSILLMEI